MRSGIANHRRNQFIQSVLTYSGGVQVLLSIYVLRSKIQSMARNEENRFGMPRQG